MILAIARNDLKRLFRSPLSWTLLAVVTFLLAFLFLTFLDHFNTRILPQNTGSANPTGTTSAIVTPVFTWAGIILMSILPLITMQNLSREYHNGTWQLLAASPVRPWKIILGKYLTNLIFILLPVGVILLMPLSLHLGSPIDNGILFSNTLGLILLLVAVSAAGVYFSTLTSETGTAALSTFGLLLFLYVLETSAKMPGNASPLFYYLSPWTHYSAFLKARFSSLHLVYFILFSGLFLWLSIRQLEKKLGLVQPGITVTSALKLLAGITVFIGLAWLSINFNMHADLSQQKNNSLQPAAASILEQMDQPLKVTAKVANNPQIHRRIKAAFLPFQQQKNNIEIQFTDSQLARLQTQNALGQDDELLLEYQGQQETIYNLEKQQIITALYRLTQGSSTWITFLQGHGELNLQNDTSEGASRLMTQLQTQGFKTFSHSLLRLAAIPDNTDILVLAGPVQNFLPAESKLIEHFITTGGNLLWLHDTEQLLGLEKLLDTLPIEFLPGIIVNADKAVQKLIGSKHPAVFPVINYNNHPIADNLDGQTIFAFSKALIATGQPPWQVSSFLQTPQASWNETDSLQGQVKPDNKTEQSGPFSIGLSLSRQHGDQEQRIVVIGDKSFISNELIGYGRNHELALRLFNWLDQSGARFNMPAQSVPDATLEFRPFHLNIIAALFLLILPLLFLLAGFRQWRKYRKHA